MLPDRGHHVAAHLRLEARRAAGLRTHRDRAQHARNRLPVDRRMLDHHALVRADACHHRAVGARIIIAADREKVVVRPLLPAPVVQVHQVELRGVADQRDPDLDRIVVDRAASHQARDQEMQPLEIARQPHQLRLGSVAQHQDMAGFRLPPVAELRARARHHDLVSAIGQRRLRQ